MLYGQSSVGGLLNFVSKRPQAEQKSELQLQYGSFDRKQIAFDSTLALWMTTARCSIAWWRSSATARPRSTTPRTTVLCSCRR